MRNHHKFLLTLKFDSCAQKGQRLTSCKQSEVPHVRGAERVLPSMLPGSKSFNIIRTPTLKLPPWRQE